MLRAHVATESTPMHEMSLAAEMLRACTQQLQGRPARIERVVVAVGGRDAVETGLLRDAGEALTADSPHAGARPEIERHRARRVGGVRGEMPDRGPGPGSRPCPRRERALRVEGGEPLGVMGRSDVSLDAAGSTGP